MICNRCNKEMSFINRSYLGKDSNMWECECGNYYIEDSNGNVVFTKDEADDIFQVLNK